MSRVITKLFRDPEAASLAIKRLKEESLDKGLSLIARSDKKAPASAHGMKHLKLKINAHEISVHGGLTSCLEAAGAMEKAEELLRSGLSLPEESYSYYMDAVSAGSLLVSFEADEEQAKKVSSLFRDIERGHAAEARSATFYNSNRMAATNTLDAAMSGDFRKY